MIRDFHFDYMVEGTYTNEQTLNMLSENTCHVVYFFYVGDVIVYIGRTNCFRKRWAQHWASDKPMKEVTGVALTIFETRHETVFYEAQQIAYKKPAWNKVGLDEKTGRGMVLPVGICAFTTVEPPLTEKRIDEICDTMELYYTQDWYDRHTDEELLQEFYRISKIPQAGKQRAIVIDEFYQDLHYDC